MMPWKQTHIPGLAPWCVQTNKQLTHQAKLLNCSLCSHRAYIQGSELVNDDVDDGDEEE